MDDDGIDLDNYDQSLKNVKFIMKNGCCRECMKAFSKTGKVSISISLFTKYSHVCVKCPDFKEELLCLLMAANIADVKDVTQSISDVINAKRLRTN